MGLAFCLSDEVGAEFAGTVVRMAIQTSVAAHWACTFPLPCSEGAHTRNFQRPDATDLSGSQSVSTNGMAKVPRDEAMSETKGERVTRKLLFGAKMKQRCQHHVFLGHCAHLL